MYEYIQGLVSDLTPSNVIIEVGGVGYLIQISVTTYTACQAAANDPTKPFRVYIHQIIREDTNELFGFADKQERLMFRHLISVSGIGANTARTILSSLNTADIQEAITSSNVNLLKSIKGIGLKTAQRIIVDLKDKVSKLHADSEIFATNDNTIKQEAFSALVNLGFSKSDVEKALEKIIPKGTNQSITVEAVIKSALKSL